MKPIQFTGRDEELQHLAELWHATTTGAGPQVITIIGESGTGKTRLVQEFYHYLTHHPQWDPTTFNYWPNAFQTPHTQLHVNPDFTAHTPKGPPLFFWTGVRWADPLQRNNVPDAALVLLRHQLIEFAQRSMAFESQWKQVLRELLQNTTSQLTWQNALGLFADSFFPLGGIIVDILMPTVTRLRSDHKSPQLAELILQLFHEWFKKPQPLPIVLWLDDAQWMDTESRDFFAELISNARLYQWPMLIIATYWPIEWHQADTQEVFLKTQPTLFLSKPHTSYLASIITSHFPGLHPHHVNLLVEKTDGNYLTLVENISELRAGADEYFEGGDTTGPFVHEAVVAINRWESTREKRIAQRFAAFDRAIQNTLARAARIGIGSRFCINVLQRFADSQHIRDISSLVATCVTSLAVIHSDTKYFYGFRERDYFKVAHKIFDQRLRTREESALLHALDEELISVIDALYSKHLTPTIPLPESITQYNPIDEILFAQLALQRFPQSHNTFFYAFVVLLNSYCRNYRWNEIRIIHDEFNDLPWPSLIQQILHIEPFKIIAKAYWMSGLIHPSGHIYTTIRDYYIDAKPTNIKQTNIVAIADIYHEVINYYIWIGNAQVGLHNCEHMRDFLITHQALFTEEVIHSFYVVLTQVEMFYFMHALKDIAQTDTITHALAHARTLTYKYPTIQHQQLLRRTLIYMGWLDDMLNESIYQEVLHLSQQIYTHTQHPDDLEDLIIAHEYITRIRIHQQQLPEAQQQCHIHMALAHKLVSQRQSPDDLKRLEMAIRYDAQIAQQTGQLSHALQQWENALDMALRILEKRQSIFDIHDAAVINRNIGEMHTEMQSFNPAITHLCDALSWYEQVISNECTISYLNRYIDTTVFLSDICLRTHQYDILITTLNRVINNYHIRLPQLQDHLDKLSVNIVNIFLMLAHVYELTHQPVKAQDTHTQLQEFWLLLVHQQVDIAPFLQQSQQFNITHNKQ